MKIVPLPEQSCQCFSLLFKLVFNTGSQTKTLPIICQLPEVRKGLYNTNLSAPKFFLKYTAWLAALKTLGAWGVFIISILDSAAFGVPMDPLVAGYVYSNPHKAWLYCLAGALGSALGSLVPYGLGRAGGELFLLKRIDEAKLQRIRDRFERQEFLALMVPATLPPPTPFKLFVFSAGVFEMRLPHFLLAIASGRLIRFGILSVLTVVFGPGIVTRVKTLFRNHPSLTVLLVIALLALAYLMFRLLRAPIKEVAQEVSHQKSTIPPGE
jgi:membrane protein YqaA with SNARE-associated domain